MAKGKYQDWLTDEGLLKLEAWARNGLTDEQIASNIGVNVKILYDWKNKYSNICNALKRGKEVIDIQVENALLKRALGYEFTEVTKERAFDLETSNYRMITTKTVKKEVQGDTTAQIFWLKNRKPDVWRDRKDVKLEGKMNTNMTNEQLDAEIQKLNELLGIADDE